MTPATYTYPGERFGMGHTPIATPTNPATGQPLSPYATQTAGPTGTLASYGHPGNPNESMGLPAGFHYTNQPTPSYTGAGAVGGFGHPAGTAPAAPYTPTANYGAATTPLGAQRAAFSGMPSVTQPIAQPGAVTSPAGGTTFQNQFGSYTVPQGDPYYAQGTQPSTNPAVFTTQPYISGLNENYYAQEANMYNANNPNAAPTTFNAANFQNYWNALTNGGTGFNPNVSPSGYGLFSGPGAQNLYAGNVLGPNMGAPAPNTGLNYTPQNAFSPQGAGSTLPNMFGQGSTGVNSGTNIAGGGGNIFGGPGMQTQNLPAGAANQYSAPGSLGPGGYALPGTTGGVNPYTPVNTSGQPTTPGATSQGPMTPDQALAALASNTGYLTNIAQGGGNPVTASPVYNAAIAAMQQQIGTGAADLAARFAGSGNLDSSAYGTAMQQYYNQAQLQENALTAQYGYQSATDAQNRLLQAAGQLNQGGTGALQQLSSQAYGATQATQQQQLQAALAMLGYGSQAAGQLSGQSYGAATGLNNAAVQAALANLQNQQFLQQLGMSGATQLSSNWNQGLQTGAQLGQQQYVDQQSQLNNIYQEFLRQQPQNNPLLQMMYSAITSYPQLYSPTYAPSSLGSLLGGAGALVGGLGGLSGIGSGLLGILASLGYGQGT